MLVGLDPYRREQPGRLLAEPPQRELQRSRARDVEPLQIVDGNDHRPDAHRWRITARNATAMALSAGAARRVGYQ